MLIVCAGTGTDVGKTWIGAAVLRSLRTAGVTVAARKPAQSFDPDDPRPTDAAVLAEATGVSAVDVCPVHRWYDRAMAPPMAAASLGRPGFGIADLVRELHWPPVAVRWVETAGGPRSPLADDGDTVDLCEFLAPDLVVLVADAGLGTLNAVRLCATALSPHPLAVVLNHYDDAVELHRANRAWLADLAPCVSAPELAGRIRCSI